MSSCLSKPSTVMFAVDAERRVVVGEVADDAGADQPRRERLLGVELDARVVGRGLRLVDRRAHVDVTRDVVARRARDRVGVVVGPVRDVRRRVGQHVDRDHHLVDDVIVLADVEQRPRLDDVHRLAARRAERAVLRLVAVAVLRQVRRAELDVLDLPAVGVRADDLAVRHRHLAEVRAHGLVGRRVGRPIRPFRVVERRAGRPARWINDGSSGTVSPAWSPSRLVARRRSAPRLVAALIAAPWLAAPHPIVRRGRARRRLRVVRVRRQLRVCEPGGKARTRRPRRPRLLAVARSP